tara:strand:- start:52001 stop:53218 length:1218 start_codon:yes stop_codon:yes gene_type:complete
MPKTIAIVGALDTKGDEILFVRDEIERYGKRALIIDIGIVGTIPFEPEISRTEVAEAAGTTIEFLKEANDRGLAVKTMESGVALIVRRLHEAETFDGIIGLGGSAGTVIATSAMRVLPIGIPKVMVSTVASGDMTNYVGHKDIVIIPSIVDIAGINRISRTIFVNAVAAVIGMVEADVRESDDNPLIAASMFGNTTEAVDKARAIMGNQGYEVLVFHCTGAGGRAMESLIAEGHIEGVLDITITEWADELVGGVLTAGPSRLDAAGQRGIPQIIVPGCLDMVNFWAPDTVPDKFRNRKLYNWNPNITLMRTNIEENKHLGKIIAEKANSSRGPVSIFLPLRGLSILDSPGNKFWWPEANQALFDSIKTNVLKSISVIEMDFNINDSPFVEAVTSQLLLNLSGDIA